MRYYKLYRLPGLMLLAALISGCASRAALPIADIGATVTAHAAAPTPGESALASGTKLSEFITEFKDATKARAHNISLASKAINKKTVQPGAVFSFNDAVGPTNKDRGYMLGRIFINGKDSKGYGGGVCQVSSTLFNAAELAGLEVTERHEHSKAVGYVKSGRDATTSYGGKDFKFTNNMPFAVRINSAVSGEKLTVSIEKV